MLQRVRGDAVAHGLHVRVEMGHGLLDNFAGGEEPSPEERSLATLRGGGPAALEAARRGDLHEEAIGYGITSSDGIKFDVYLLIRVEPSAQGSYL